MVHNKVKNIPFFWISPSLFILTLFWLDFMYIHLYSRSSLYCSYIVPILFMLLIILNPPFINKEEIL